MRTRQITALLLVMATAAACTSSVAPTASHPATSASTQTPTTTAAPIPTSTQTPTTTGAPTSTPTPTTSPPSPAPSIDRTPEPNIDHGHLGEAAAYLRPDADQLYFTDWSAIKASIGREEVTSASPIDDRLGVVLELGRSEAGATGFARDHLREHAEVWGFDSLDFHWEAMIQGEGAPAWVLRFEAGIDLAPVIARFDEREFTTETYAGVTIRSLDLDVAEDWIRASEFAILNTALMPDGQTFVLSSGIERVRSVIDQVTDPGAAPIPFANTVGVLSGASAAILLVGTGTCSTFDPAGLPRLPPERLAAIRQQLADAGPLSAYDALGVGYSRTWDPIGRIAFAYSDPDTALTDLPARRTLAEDGDSLVVAGRYSEAVFTVNEAGAADGVITLDVAPIDDRPRRLIDMVFVRDMLFAACGS